MCPHDNSTKNWDILAIVASVLCVSASDTSEWNKLLYLVIWALLDILTGLRISKPRGRKCIKHAFYAVVYPMARSSLPATIWSCHIKHSSEIWRLCSSEMSEQVDISDDNIDLQRLCCRLSHYILNMGRHRLQWVLPLECRLILCWRGSHFN